MKTIQVGSKGKRVEVLQADLVILGYDLGKFGPNKNGVDGSFGALTAAAVKDFQTKNGLQPNGIADESTIYFVMKASWRKQGILHFSPNELMCPCGSCEGIPPEGVDIVFLRMLELVRQRNGNRVLIIRSPYRCEAHNAKIGGAGGSQHMAKPVWAADILSPGVSPRDLEKICLEVFRNHGVGTGGRTIVHVDRRPKAARWKYN